MKRSVLMGALMPALAFAAPVVSNVRSVQDPSSRVVTITYDLSVGQDDKSEPGVVTLSVEWNGQAIDDEYIANLEGDVNVLVAAGEDHVIKWHPDKSWPGHKITDKSVRIGVKAWATNAPPNYMVVDLSGNAKPLRYFTSEKAIPFGVTNDMYKTDYLVMRKIPAAGVTWRMGSPLNEPGRTGNREVPHNVTLTKDYYIGVYELTQKQYEQFMSLIDPNHSPKWSNPYFNNSAYYKTRPLDNATFTGLYGKFSGETKYGQGNFDPDYGFIRSIRARTGVKFDFPTEAQWEFAARGGCCGDAIYGDSLDDIARCKTNGGYVDGTTPPDQSCSTDNGTAAVGSYQPNAFGLYDMLGNLWEFCVDKWQTDNVSVDPEKGPTKGQWNETQHVIRGGGWDSDVADCRLARRSPDTTSWDTPYNNVGYRLWAPAEAPVK